MKPIIIKTYDKERQYQKDAARMLHRGYEVVTMTTRRKKSGCGRLIMTGGLGAILRGSEFVVTYRLTT